MAMYFKGMNLECIALLFRRKKMAVKVGNSWVSETALTYAKAKADKLTQSQEGQESYEQLSSVSYRA